MSNLGNYQKMTLLAKKVGGPINLALIFIITGGCIGALIEYCIGNKYKKKAKKAIIYNVTKNASDKYGLKFNINDQFKILKKIDDIILIEKIGDNNNPYCVSSNFLKSASNYNE